MNLNNKLVTFHQEAFVYIPKLNSPVIIGRQDDTTVLYGILFNETDLFKCNEIIQSYLNNNLATEEGRQAIIRFLNDSAVFDLHPSIIQSILLFTGHLEETKGVTKQLANKIDSIIDSFNP